MFDEATKVTKVVFDSSFANARPTSTYGWFWDMVNLTTITGFNYLNTSEVTNMSYMFADCGKLTKLDFSHFNTSKVTEMSHMFYCSGFTSPDLTSFNTAKVTTMSAMFDGCNSLIDLDLSSFTFKSSTVSDYMMAYCTSLKYLTVNGTAKYLNNNACYYLGSIVKHYLYYGENDNPNFTGSSWKSGNFIGIEELDFNQTGNSGDYNFVDLGLPSKTVWSYFNYGANKPEQTGNYYAWYELTPKSKYTWANYDNTSPDWYAWDWCERLKFEYQDWQGNFDWDCDFTLTEDTSHDDIFNLSITGYNSGIACTSDYQELVQNCDMLEKKLNGVKGIQFTSKNNGKRIFMPYAGSYYDNSTPASGTASYYWTEEYYNEKQAYAILLKDGALTITQCQRRTGLPIRLIGEYYDRDNFWSNTGNFSETDGINNVKGQTSTDGTIYTLQGVKVEGKPQPGIYVRNGRKVVVK